MDFHFVKNEGEHSKKLTFYYLHLVDTPKSIIYNKMARFQKSGEVIYQKLSERKPSVSPRQT